MFSDFKKTKIILAVIAISLINGLQFCVSPVLNSISEHYSAISVSLIQMLVTAPSLLAMVIALVSGWMVLKVSKKKLLLAACLIAGVAGFLPYLSDNFWLLLFSRMIYGIGLGIVTALNTAVIAEFFEGNERMTVMGIQGASMGIGMTLVNLFGGILGSQDFTRAYLVNIIGFISMAIIAFCLPDTGTVKLQKSEKIRMNASVWKICALTGFEFLFLIAFSTNIAMHLSGSLAGNSSISGTLSSIFSASQIVIGLVLGQISKKTGRYTLQTAMLSFCLGAAILALFPDNFVLLAIGSIFCGISQGMFMPSAMNEVSNIVAPAATAMAAAWITVCGNVTQIISPYVLNTASRILFGETTTGHVYAICAGGLLLVTLVSLRKK